MWDNKSKEKPGKVSLKAHIKQFHEYMEKFTTPPSLSSSRALIASDLTPGSGPKKHSPFVTVGLVYHYSAHRFNGPEKKGKAGVSPAFGVCSMHPARLCGILYVLGAKMFHAFGRETTSKVRKADSSPTVLTRITSRSSSCRLNRRAVSQASPSAV